MGWRCLFGIGGMAAGIGRKSGAVDVGRDDSETTLLFDTVSSGNCGAVSLPSQQTNSASFESLAGRWAALGEISGRREIPSNGWTLGP